MGHEDGRLVTIPDEGGDTNVLSTGQFGSTSGLSFEDRMDRGRQVLIFNPRYQSSSRIKSKALSACIAVIRCHAFELC